MALSSSGTVEAQQLYAPYGTVRYSSGTMPTVTDHGYTGQITDAATGLDSYGVRYLPGPGSRQLPQQLNPALVAWSRHDSDLDSLRDMPGYQALFTL